ncbi:DUF2515 domain-containing protein [Paenibacillus chungangensis]|uniref:DUF2515 domain-containing protein n=1 Tax=Paenibacillus chungangensis TaxID=696535 RepID=A0ABW3HPB1_9BACL
MRKNRYLDAIGNFIAHLAALPGAALSYAVGKWKSMQDAKELIAEAQPLELSSSAVAKLMDACARLELSEAGLADKEEAVDVAGPFDSLHGQWKADELMLIERIRSETTVLNRNNLTRTEAYRSMYFQMPELHWALLAHLVSRNGGWNMTDLQGEWLPRLLTSKQRQDIFLFLERANALIFGDAYPQLLLYQWSVREGRSLFHLLPALGVSRFMLPVWKQFWRERDSALLSTALIVNEQQYIQERVVEDDYFQKHVLGTLFFGMQSLLQLNAVLFPYGSGKAEAEEELELAGLILERFGDPVERIQFGKRLYALLFGIAPVYEGARSFAAAVKHTGSRADYAPMLFASVRREPPDRYYKEKLIGGRLKPGASPIYSPSLESSWHDQSLQQPKRGDWFRSVEQVKPYFSDLPFPRQFQMTNEYRLMLNKLELAVLAAHREKSKRR